MIAGTTKFSGVADSLMFSNHFSNLGFFRIIEHNEILNRAQRTGHFGVISV